MGYEADQDHASAEQDSAGDQEFSGSQDVAKPTAERRGERTHQVVTGQREPDDCRRPSKAASLLQGHAKLRHHDAGRHRNGLSEDLDNRQNRDDHPRVVKTAGGSANTIKCGHSERLLWGGTGGRQCNGQATRNDLPHQVSETGVAEAKRGTVSDSTAPGTAPG